MDILGLPLHPLVVHAAVVLVPLASVGALLLVGVARLRLRYGWVTVALAVAAAASALIARFSGDALAEGLGIGSSPAVQAHRMWGVWAPWPALLMALGLLALVTTSRSMDGPRAVLRRVAAGVTAVAAVASLVLILLTGHSGATSVWGV